MRILQITALLSLLGHSGALAEKVEDGADTPSLELRCAGVFGDNAIFQRAIPVPVWGWTAPGAKVTVSFGEQVKAAVAGADGRWDVSLDAMEADKLDSLDKAPDGRTLSVTSASAGKKEMLSFSGILIGEVWLCSGQSNMAAKVKHNHANQDPNDNLFESNLPAIRQISLPEGWRNATPDSVGEFTRVGFCFARRVQQELKVPIGLLNSCVGGSSIESWMRIPPAALPEDPKAKKMEYGKLYRERMAPLVGYGIRGALWYQGEANSSEGHSYFLKMESMINDWRASWKHGDFPFYFVQLAGISESPEDNPAMGDGRARIREAQRQVLTMKNTGMAVAVDIGEKKEHPANKVEVGIRLAHWALHHTYGKAGIVPSGPLYKGFKAEGDAIRISFDHADGLMFGDKKDYFPPAPAPDAKLPWLSIQSKDGTWHWADARVAGNDLIVSSKEAKEPVAVRYAYTNHPDGIYLYNSAGLPASPFATDTKAE